MQSCFSQTLLSCWAPTKPLIFGLNCNSEPKQHLDSNTDCLGVNMVCYPTSDIFYQTDYSGAVSCWLVRKLQLTGCRNYGGANCIAGVSGKSRKVMLMQNSLKFRALSLKKKKEERNRADFKSAGLGKNTSYYEIFLERNLWKGWRVLWPDAFFPLIWTNNTLGVSIQQISVSGLTRHAITQGVR